MRKYSAHITVMCIITLLLLTSLNIVRNNLPLVITGAVFLTLFFSYFYFEKSLMGTKEIALIATLSAFAGTARIFFAFIPGVQPTTFIVSISGLVFGPYEGFLIGSTGAFISNIFLGQGPWSPWQMFSWGLIGFISGVIGKHFKEISVEKFSILCFLYGFLFDWIMNLWHILGFVSPITWKSIIAAYITGITFDVMHAGGNFIFSMIFYNKFLKVFKRFKRRLEVTYIK